ncbi:hypothetical protein NPIL_374461 [Nephila pilipes]|uniref:Transmembrane protein n=1 Tax=Nephila pilipes TaxID=299642 RepID=A0A8X6TC61_NEPPI|nr:hypothetical protein NPIL_374461 [Nephila pilipes]
MNDAFLFPFDDDALHFMAAIWIPHCLLLFVVLRINGILLRLVVRVRYSICSLLCFISEKCDFSAKGKRKRKKKSGGGKLLKDEAVTNAIHMDRPRVGEIDLSARVAEVPRIVHESYFVLLARKKKRLLNLTKAKKEKSAIELLEGSLGGGVFFGCCMPYRRVFPAPSLGAGVGIRFRLEACFLFIF